MEEDNKKAFEEEAKRILLEKESKQNTETNETPNSLGKVQVGYNPHENESFLASEVGLLTVPIDTLPSKGYFLS